MAVGHHAEVGRVGNGMVVSSLAFFTTDFMLDRFETGFDFPVCAVVFDNLPDGKIGMVVRRATPCDFR